MSEKIGEQHLARRAILYVRQSSPQQLAHNEESRRQQYAMRDRLYLLGWRDIEVIDEDLGKSAAGSVERSGFRRLVADVSLGQIGAVAAREVSRFARNSRDWQQLIEICRVVDTLLVDHDTVYAPRLSNDRLLLGLKGSLNEYELDLLRLRGLEARRQKAERGDLIAGVPVGYREGEDGRLEKTPDARVRQVIELTFAKFFELGSARQVMLWMRELAIQVPVNRDRHGRVIWKDVTAEHVYRTLNNPVYAGANVYGRKKRHARVVDGQVKFTEVRQPRDKWPVLLKGHHEEYITWEQFERAKDMLSKNAQNRGVTGAARGGAALLGGIVWCRRCGHRLRVGYSGTRNRVGRYTCDDANNRAGDPRCISFSAFDVDVQVAQQVLAVVRPGAIEAARSAWLEDTGARDAAVEALELQLQQARYQAQRAERQYDAVDPENRTVALELERRWNAALDAVRAIEQRIAEATLARDRAVASPPDAGSYLDLARDLNRVWNAPTSDLTLKKRIVRAVVEQIWADVDDARSEVVLVVHWKGGAHTELRVAKRKTGQRRNTTPIEVVEAVRTLTRVMRDEQIARWLGRAGLRTPSGAHYTRALVASVRHLHGIQACSVQRGHDEWLTCEEAAALIQVDPKTLRRAAQRKEIPAIHPLPNGPWIFARSDVVGTEAAARIAARARAHRQGRNAGPVRNQLVLGIPRT
jgi:DNA invertase Pin-like site-specific DNA recombinase